MFSTFFLFFCKHLSLFWILQIFLRIFQKSHQHFLSFIRFSSEFSQFFFEFSSNSRQIFLKKYLSFFFRFPSAFSDPFKNFPHFVSVVLNFSIFFLTLASTFKFESAINLLFACQHAIVLVSDVVGSTNVFQYPCTNTVPTQKARLRFSELESQNK